MQILPSLQIVCVCVLFSVYKNCEQHPPLLGIQRCTVHSNESKAANGTVIYPSVLVHVHNRNGKLWFLKLQSG